MDTIPHSRLKNSLINHATVPPLTITSVYQPCKNIYYAFLQTNENMWGLYKKYTHLRLDGSFIGVGFGGSLILLSYFFKDLKGKVILCDREPFVYLLGKMLCILMQREKMFEDVLLRFLNSTYFSYLYQESLSREEKDSPIFLRISKEEKGVPAPLHAFRKHMFQIEGDFSPEEYELFFGEKNVGALLAKQRAWVRKFLEKRAFYIMRILQKEYQFFQHLFSHNVTPLCADIFHPDVWEYLGKQRDWFSRSSMVYFSNAHLYSQGSGRRSETTTTTSPYQTPVFRQFIKTLSSPFYFAYTTQKDSSHYEVKIQDTIPESEDLYQS